MNLPLRLSLLVSIASCPSLAAAAADDQPAAGAASTPAASQLWGATGGLGTSIALRPIDAATGAFGAETTIGADLSRAAIYDLADDPARQPSVVWALRGSASGTELVAVDPFRRQLLSLIAVSAPAPILSLAIDPTDGAFYGASSSALYRIAPDTGAAALVGISASPVGKALGFDAAGGLYGISNENVLVSVNKSTGETTVVAALDVLRMEDLAVRPEDGVLFGLGYSSSYYLYQVDPVDAQVVEVGLTLGRSGGLAFTFVPEPSGAALAVIAAMAVGRKTLLQILTLSIATCPLSVTAATGLVRTVALSGQAAPSTTGDVSFTQLLGVNTDFAPAQGPIVNDAGHVAFHAQSQRPGEQTQRGGLWSEAGGTLQVVARAGDQTPGLPAGRNLSFYYDSFVFNAMDQTAFTGRWQEVSTKGIWLHEAGITMPIARTDG